MGAVKGDRASLLEEPRVGFTEMSADLLDVGGAERFAQLRDFYSRGSWFDVREGVRGDFPVVVFGPVFGDVKLEGALLLVAGCGLGSCCSWGWGGGGGGRA